MKGIVQTFTYDFTLRSINNDGMITTPFTIVCHSDDLKIETEVKNKWPQFLKEREISFDEAKELIAMKQYLKRNVLNSVKTLQQIHEYCYTQDWMLPLLLSQKITSLNINEVDCKYWTDPNIPYLEISGYIYFDLKKMIRLYFDRNLVSFKYSNKFIKEDLQIEFIKQFPLFLTYNESPVITKYILDYVNINLNKKGSFIDQILINKFKLKEFYKYKKEVKWIANRIIGVGVKDWWKVLKQNASNNALPLTMGGLIGMSLYKRQQQKKATVAILNTLNKLNK